MDITDVINITDDMEEKVTTRATSKYLPYLFLHTSNNRRYRALKLDLVDKHIPREVKYP